MENLEIKSTSLRLPLNRKYFTMTKEGIKKEDYREITPYWLKRLTQYDAKNYNGFEIDEIVDFIQKGKHIIFKRHHGYLPDFCFPKRFDYNLMTLGYPQKQNEERILKLEHKGIIIRPGKPEWGAVPDKLYFVIMHGSIMS